MKRLAIILISLMCFQILLAGTPQQENKYSSATLVSAGSWDTITVTGISMNGDSIGFAVGFNKDSISGFLMYQLVTPNGYSDATVATSTTMTLKDGTNNFTNTGDIQAVFTRSIDRVAGSYNAYLYLIYQNNNSTAQTITTNINQVTWR